MENLETLTWSFSPAGIYFSFRWELITLLTCNNCSPIPGSLTYSMASCSAPGFLSPEVAMLIRTFSPKILCLLSVLTAHYIVFSTCRFRYVICFVFPCGMLSYFLWAKKEKKLYVLQDLVISSHESLQINLSLYKPSGIS